MTLLVFGGRDWTNQARTFAALDAVHAKHGITLLISGGARGADAMAEQWADSRGIPKHVENAKWDELGKRAGPVRNRKMLAMNPDAGVKFPGGRGTADMLGLMKSAGKPVWEPYG